MPFHKIGEQSNLVKPSTLRRSQMDSSSVSDDQINRWFEDAFLPLQNDPYIHIKMDNAVYSQLLMAVNPGKRAMSIKSAGKKRMPFTASPVTCFAAR